MKEKEDRREETSLNNRIILASHSELAYGLMKTTAFFTGVQLEILEQTDQESGFSEKVRDILTSGTEENIIVFTDLYGGSVNQTFFRQLQNQSFHLVTGMNLAVILECVLASQIIDDEFLRQAVESARGQLYYMNDLLSETDEG